MRRYARSAGTARSGRPGALLDLQVAGAHRAEQRRACDINSRSTPARRSSCLRRTRRGRREEPRRQRVSSATTSRPTFEPGSPTSSPCSRRKPTTWRADPIAVVRPNARLFVVPKELVKILNRDLTLAGISKSDDRGRTIDVHAFRTTFGTLLSKGGVPSRRRTSRNASQRHRAHHERLHRSETLGR